MERLEAGYTEGEIAAAEALVEQAQAQVDLLNAGYRPEEIAAAAAARRSAETDLMQAQLYLADKELRAPFDGVVAALDLRVGQQVTAGLPVAQLADASSWLIETTDLTELYVVGVEVGDQVEVEFDALSDLALTGTVTSIRSYGEDRLGDVTYRVTVSLDAADPRLRWGLTAFILFNPAP